MGKNAAQKAAEKALLRAGAKKVRLRKATFSGKKAVQERKKEEKKK